MDNDLFRHAVLLLFGIVFYAVLTRGLFKATEPLRREAFDIGERLSHSAELSDQAKYRIYESLGHVHSAWQAWKFVGLLVVLFFVIPFVNFHKVSQRADDGVPHLLIRDFHRFKTCWLTATLGNSPVAMFLFIVLALLLIAFFASLSTISAFLMDVAEHRHHHNSAAT